LILFLYLIHLVASQMPANTKCGATAQSFYNSGLSATLANGTAIPMSSFQGKVTLVLNVASFWGHTISNYFELNALYEKYPSSSFVILAMPCAQFLNQEPGTDDEIQATLQYVRPGNGFLPKFPLYQKIMVNGDLRHPIYTYLTGICPATMVEILPLEYITWTPVRINDITWNFEKFLIGKNGMPYKRYNPSTDPIFLRDDIEMLMRSK